MKKRKFPILLVLGASLVLISFVFVVVFQIRVYMGSNVSRKVIAEMESVLSNRSAGIPGLYLNTNMPVLEIDNVDYSAVIEIPSFGITLPVADKWNSGKLFASPARFFGSAYNNTLVIGGADYSNQFAFCDKIDNGAVITVTDMTGAQFSYAVTCVERSQNAENQWLIDTCYDLTVFCRDLYSMEYIAVRCNLAYN